MDIVVMDSGPAPQVRNCGPTAHPGMTKRGPFDRQGTAREVAYAAPFLISNESSYVNTHSLFLDAGHMAGIARS
jgi:NAD(P)-dependent dehydrogenase (short-subunit alcohol dehydrogenase family)